MTKSVATLSKWLFGVAGIAASVYSLVHFGHWDVFSAPPLSVMIMLASLAAIDMLARAARLYRAAHAVGERLSFWQAAVSNALGDIFGAITPSGVGGEVSRLAGVVRSGIKTSRAIEAMAVERVALMMSLGMLLTVLVIGISLLQPTIFDLPTLRHTLWIYFGLLIVLVIFVGLFIRYKKLHRGWRHYLLRADLIILSLLHHLIRVGVLPLIVFLLTDRPVSILVLVWSFILSYGLPLLPLPSGGGAIEVTFMTALTPLIGEGLATEALVLWRMSMYYLYLVSSAVITAIGSWRAPRRGGSVSIINT